MRRPVPGRVACSIHAVCCVEQFSAAAPRARACGLQHPRCLLCRAVQRCGAPCPGVWPATGRGRMARWPRAPRLKRQSQRSEVPGMACGPAGYAALGTAQPQSDVSARRRADRVRSAGDGPGRLTKMLRGMPCPFLDGGAGIFVRMAANCSEFVHRFLPGGSLPPPWDGRYNDSIPLLRYHRALPRAVVTEEVRSNQQR